MVREKLVDGRVPYVKEGGPFGNSNARYIGGNWYFGDFENGDYSRIEPDGSMSSVGKATRWNDHRFSLTGQRVDVSGGRLNYNYFNGAIGFLSTARYPEEPISIIDQIGHDFAYGTPFNPHIHWFQQSANVPNWLLAYKVMENGETLSIETDYTNHTFLTIQSNAFTYSSGTLFQISSFGEIDTTGLTLSDHIHYVLFRDSANTSTEFAGADPSALEEFVVEFDVHYQIDASGSRLEYTK